MLLPLAISLQCAPAAVADDPQVLKQQEARLDVAKPQPAPSQEGTQSSTGSGSVPMLNGSVEKRSLSEQTSDSAPELQTETAVPGIREKALEKLAKRKSLTGEEFRSLNVGISGMNCRQMPFTTEAIVIKVYPDSPADQAGIEVGDILLGKKVYAPSDPTRTMFTFTCNEAGSTKDYQIKHNGEIRNVRLVLMNIEDIKDDEARRLFEYLVEQTGAPAVDVPVHMPITAGSILRHVVGF